MGVVYYGCLQSSKACMQVSLAFTKSMALKASKGYALSWPALDLQDSKWLDAMTAREQQYTSSTAEHKPKPKRHHQNTMA